MIDKTKAYKTKMNSRELERNALGNITGNLITTSNSFKIGDVVGKDLTTALTKNLKIWNIFRIAVLDPDNELPEETKAGILSLSLWVQRHTSDIFGGTAHPSFLIDINKDIIAGLC